MSSDPQAQDIGRLEGIVDMLRDQHKAPHEKLDAMSGEITGLKVEAGKQGAVYGGVMGIGVALIAEWLRSKVTGGGPG